MKTAIYIEDGAVQLVLTPENDFERQTVGSIADKTTTLQVFHGMFYDCRGGWTRQREVTPGAVFEPRECSLIIRLGQPIQSH